MDSADLKKIQSPLKERYRSNPSSALITLRARGTIGEAISCKVETGRAIVEAGLHPATGGTGLLACSGDLLLEALVACAGVTLNAVATAIGAEITNCTLRAEGDIDFRGTLGVSKDTPVGFKEIRLHIELGENMPPDKKASLLKLAERYCVVYQTLIAATPVKILNS